MVTEKRRKEIAESLRRLAASYSTACAEIEETLIVLCRKLDLEEITFRFPSTNPHSAGAFTGSRQADLVVDRTTFSVRWNGRKCFLGNTFPFRLLERLSRRPNQYISCDQLLDEVWGGLRSPSAIRSVVKVLRQRLRRAGMRDLARAVNGRTAGHYVLVR